MRWSRGNDDHAGGKPVRWLAIGNLDDLDETALHEVIESLHGVAHRRIVPWRYVRRVAVLCLALRLLSHATSQYAEIRANAYSS